MAKKKLPRKITIKNPKIGTKYYFRFAGSTYYGKLVNNCEELSEKVGIKYFMFTSSEDNNKTRYPIAINEIANTENELKHSGNV